MRWKIRTGMVTLAIIAALGAANSGAGKVAAAQSQKQTAGVPIFQVDPFWPKMEANWTFGSIGGLAIDPVNDHVWVLQRPRTLDKDENYATLKPPVGDCCVPAKPVMEFDSAGNLIQQWGGPGTGYDWPEDEHGLTIDYKGNVWIGGDGKDDNQILKFTKAGKFLLQIGHPGKSKGSLDTENLNRAAKALVYPKTNEVFVADGYQNRRVIVFDADTGKFKRMWGAYGNQPDDEAPRTPIFEGPPSQQFSTVHAVLISNDDLLYVADRVNNRIQIFKPDGTFIKEAFVVREVRIPAGTAADMAFSPDSRQQFLYVNGSDQHVRVLDRSTMRVVETIGRLGHYPGQFHHVHVLAVDSKGNLYTGENCGKKVQKFVFKGYSPAPATN